MSEEIAHSEAASDTVGQEPFYNRVREGIVVASLLCFAGVALRFFAPKLAGKNDTLFLRTNALQQISVWLFILGAVLLILCFAFWLADGMLANRKDNQS